MPPKLPESARKSVGMFLDKLIANCVETKACDPLLGLYLTNISMQLVETAYMWSVQDGYRSSIDLDLLSDPTNYLGALG